ncbi:TlpA family protein disulfide reductase [Candidatus Pacearchaeota archaeon]|nr:TlpA family protein disulfide reductase [Candidatus Pacearchaeota archaeon]
MKTKKIFWIWSILGIVIIFGIVIFSFNSKQLQDSTAVGQGPLSWMNIELKDVRTGETFKISDFEGKPVLIESFAVWCPICTKQQKEIKKLHEEISDSVVSISLDTDPNEDESKILNHIQENGFDWYYAISPIEMTQSLINEFGNSIINAPSAPVVLICEDGSFRKLSGSGSRNVDKLKEEIEKGC